MENKLVERFRKTLKIPNTLEIAIRRVFESDYFDFSLGGTEEDIEKFKNQDHLVQVVYEGISEKDEEDPDYRVGYFRVIFKAKVV